MIKRLYRLTLDPIVSPVCLFVWCAAERLDVRLGRLAPWVFGGMMGSWPRKVSGPK